MSSELPRGLGNAKGDSQTLGICESRISLVRAALPSGEQVYGESFEEKKLAESLALGYLEAFLKRHDPSWDVQVINPVLEEISEAEVAQRVVRHRPLSLGISLTYQWQRPWAEELARRVKQTLPGVHIVLGGIYVTSAWRRLLSSEFFDSACLFEGEQTFLELVRCLRQGDPWAGLKGLAHRQGEGGASGRQPGPGPGPSGNPTGLAKEHADRFGEPISAGRRRRILKLQELPFPTRGQTPGVLASGGVVQVEASRGCNAHCTFCDLRKTGWIGRPADHVVDELERLSEQFPGSPVWFIDNIFLGFGKKRFDRAWKIVEGIRNRGLNLRFSFMERAENVEEDLFRAFAEVGLGKIYLGIESLSQTALDRWMKGSDVETNLRALRILEDVGIFTQFGYLVFDDGTTLVEIAEGLHGLRQVGEGSRHLHLFNLNELIPYTGTHLESRYIETYGQRPDLDKGQVWQFRDARVLRFRDAAWAYLMGVWPVTEVLFHQADDPSFQRDLPSLLEVSNQQFLDHLDALFVAAQEGGSEVELAAEAQRRAVLATRELTARLEEPWLELENKALFGAALDRIHAQPAFGLDAS